MEEAICLRCEMVETWEYVIQCSENSRGRKVAKILIETSLKKRPKEVQEDVVIWFVKEITKHMRNEEEEEYKTN